MQLLWLLRDSKLAIVCYEPAVLLQTAIVSSYCYLADVMYCFRLHAYCKPCCTAANLPCSSSGCCTCANIQVVVGIECRVLMKCLFHCSLVLVCASTTTSNMQKRFANFVCTICACVSAASLRLGLNI